MRSTDTNKQKREWQRHNTKFGLISGLLSNLARRHYYDTTTGISPDAQGCGRYVCNYCGKHFMNSGHLKSHLMLHTGERPYKCSFCDKSFVQKPHLTVHLRTHTGEKPFKCHVCQKGFTCTSNLKAHLGTHK